MLDIDTLKNSFRISKEFEGVFLLAAPAGTGKTTLCINILSEANGRSLYITSEQTTDDVVEICERVGSNPINVRSEKNQDKIISMIEEGNYDYVVIDSFQEIIRTTTIASLWQDLRRLVDDSIIKGLIIINQMNSYGKISGGTKGPHICDSVAVMSRSILYDGQVIVKVVKNRQGENSKGTRFSICENGFTYEGECSYDEDHLKRISKIVTPKLRSHFNKSYNPLDLDKFSEDFGFVREATQIAIKEMENEQLVVKVKDNTYKTVRVKSSEETIKELYMCYKTFRKVLKKVWK